MSGAQVYLHRSGLRRQLAKPFLGLHQKTRIRDVCFLYRCNSDAATVGSYNSCPGVPCAGCEITLSFDFTSCSSANSAYCAGDPLSCVWQAKRKQHGSSIRWRAMYACISSPKCLRRCSRSGCAYCHAPPSERVHREYVCRMISHRHWVVLSPPSPSAARASVWCNPSPNPVRRVGKRWNAMECRCGGSTRTV